MHRARYQIRHRQARSALRRADQRFEEIDQRLDVLEERFRHRFDTMERRFEPSVDTGLRHALAAANNDNMVGLEGRLAMRFTDATRMTEFAVLPLMTGVITAVITPGQLNRQPTGNGAHRVTATGDRAHMVGDHDEWRRRQRRRAAVLVTVIAASWIAAIMMMLVLRQAWPLG